MPKAQGSRGDVKPDVIGKTDSCGNAEGPWWEGFPTAQHCVNLIEHASELSSTNSNLMTPDQLEELWFGVLGCTVQWQEKTSATKPSAGKDASRRHSGLAIAFADLGSQAMTGVLAYLSLPNALKWICDKFG